MTTALPINGSGEKTEPVAPRPQGMPDPELMARVLGEVAEALERAQLPYGVIGGIASAGFGRPRWTHDIDILVRPEDAPRVMDVLRSAGFTTELTDHSWIYKAFRYGVMVDIIFRSTGGVHFDDRMAARVVDKELRGHRVKLVPPEDLLIMKAMIHDELGPRHWHDALGLVAGGKLDWAYLESRAMRAPRRVLALLIYAHSLDLYVPNDLIQRLYALVYER